MVAENIVVFDFDKTLTERDTFFDFIRYCTPKIRFHFSLGPYFFLVILYKLLIISNTTLKRGAVFLFLSGIDYNYILERSKKFSSQIKLKRKIYEIYKSYLNDNWIVYISSASFTIYFESLFNDSIVIGSTLKIRNDKVVGLLFNNYGENKRIEIERRGVRTIKYFYTDSFADRPLIEMSNRTIMVKGNNLIEFENL